MTRTPSPGHHDHRGGAPTDRRIPRLRGLALGVVVLLLLLTACSSDDASVDTAGSTATMDMAEGDMAEGELVGLAGDASSMAPAEVAAEEGSAAGDGDAASADGPVAPLPDTATTGERVIKEGTVTIEVAPGDFDAAFGQVISRVQALGGHVAGTSSSTTSDPDGNPLVSGQVTVRVPVRSFEDLLTSIGDAGEITDRNVTSQDVTAEYTDLESRRRNLQAQERFYLGLLDRAASVTDAIAVQQQLDDIQGQIEQITGRLNLLQDRTAFSTLTVRIAERGAEATLLERDQPGGLTPYIEDAVDTLVATVGSLIVFITFLLPFSVLALIGYAVWRRVRGRRTAPVTPTAATAAPPVPVEEAPAEAGADR